MEQMKQLAKERIHTVLGELKHTHSELMYPLTKMQWEERETSLSGLSTDGMRFFYHPVKVLQESKERLKKEILHIIFHGLLGHFQIKDDYEDVLCRDMIMDIQVMYMMLRAEPKWQEMAYDLSKYEKLLNKDFSMGQYQYLTRIREQLDRKTYEYVCRMDDHGVWEEETEKKQGKPLIIFWKDCRNMVFGEEAGEDGEEVSQRMKRLTNILTKYGKNNYGNSEGNQTDCFVIGKEGKKDYGELLSELFQKQEVSREEPDSIDPMFYHYGMELYEDMPLIEPLESWERPCIGTIVIAVDVSGSCTEARIMKAFWGETYHCIRWLQRQQAEGEVLLLQCDTRIQKEKWFSLEDITEVPEKVEVTGMGGTSFVPVFERVEELIEKGKQVDALLYLTDGFGLYPKNKPDFPVYFVLPAHTEKFRFAPEWVEKVYLGV